MESNIDEVKTTRCDQRFKIFSDYKKSFGAEFDKLMFLDYTTGKTDVPGASLRSAQTGCEIYERLGWDDAKHNFDGFHKCGCKQFDEQLRFVSEEKKPLSNIEYKLKLETGRIVEGKTDNDGKTMRIKSANKPLKIEKVDFFLPDKALRCPNHICGPLNTEESVKMIEIDGIETNQVNVGSSFQEVTVKIKSRPLTAGEIEMAKLIFKDSINYSTVKIHNEEYLPFGLQPNGDAMAPDGEIYLNPNKYKDFPDFSKAKIDYDKMWFMHEMTHVWQYQRGYSLTWNGFWIFITGGYISDRAYKFDPSDWKDPKDSSKDSPDLHKTFPDFNMEQQARIVEQYFGGKYLNIDVYLFDMKFYERVLNEFLRRPKNAALLPK